MAGGELPSDWTSVRRAPSASWSRLGDEILIIDTRRRRSHRLLETAAFIWDRCDGRSFEMLISDVTTAYDVSPGAAKGDLGELLARWRELGLVEVAA